MKKNLLVLCIPLILCACASPTIIETRKADDAKLTCAEIEKEILDAENFEKAARQERTVTGANIARTLLFWPALVGTYTNTEEAINAAKERKANLLKQSEKMSCKSNL